MYIRWMQLIKRTICYLGLGICLLTWACSEESAADSSNQHGNTDQTEGLPIDSSSRLLSHPEPDKGRDTSALEKTLIKQGLVNVADLSDQFVVQMMYSTDDNFLNEDVYGDYDLCYLQPEIADKLVIADSLLQSKHPDLRLVLFDCVRPRSVQYQMWEIVKGTDQQNYVAPPGGSGSMHNYGAAVDLGLYHVDTGIVDMGTPFDFFGPLAQPRFETKFLRSGALSQAQINHRAMLRIAMNGAGFQGILSEWWHFIGFDRPVVRQKYQIVE